MNNNEFIAYLEENIPNAFEGFLLKALDYQKVKNQKRQPAKRWNENRLERAAYGMWKSAMEIPYNSIFGRIKPTERKSAEAWIEYMKKIEFLATLEEQLGEVSFEEN